MDANLERLSFSLLCHIYHSVGDFLGEENESKRVDIKLEETALRYQGKCDMEQSEIWNIFQFPNGLFANEATELLEIFLTL